MNSQERPSKELERLSPKTIHFEQRFRVGWSDLDGNMHMGNTSYLDHAPIRAFFSLQSTASLLSVLPPKSSARS